MAHQKTVNVQQPEILIYIAHSVCLSVCLSGLPGEVGGGGGGGGGGVMEGGMGQEEAERREVNS